MVTEIVYRRLRGLFCLLAAVFCLSATGAWGAAATIAVRGSVGGGVDTIVAVPVVRGTLDGTNMLQSVAVPVKAGAFTVNVAKDKDWLFVLENSTITGPGRVVGQIAFQTGEAGNTLLLLPVSSAAVTKINIGQVVLTNGEWLAGIPLSAASFAMTPAQLSMLARYDDRFAGVKNLVLNTSGSTGVSYSLRPDFSWYGNYAELTRSYSQPWNYGYRGYNFQLDTNAAEPTVTQLCSSSGLPAVTVRLSPPAGAIVEGRGNQFPASDESPAPFVVYSDSNAISNNNAVCGTTTDGAVQARDEDFYAGTRNGITSITFGNDLLTDPIPGGDWLYTVAGQVKAQFNLGSADPLNSSGSVNGVAPTARITTDSLGKITAVDIAWIGYNQASGSYEPITDMTVLQHLVAGGDIFFENTATGQRRYESVSFDPPVLNQITPSLTWFYGYGGTAGEQAESMGVFYSSAGIGYFIHFQRYVYPAGAPVLSAPFADRYITYPTPVISDTCPIMSPLPDFSLVSSGQQFNNDAHNGLDFRLTWSTTPFYRPVIAPSDGIIQDIKYNDYIKGYDVSVRYNETWYSLLVFEPFPLNLEPAIMEQQRKEIVFYITNNQVVRRGQVIGRLVVTEPEPTGPGPTVHWGVMKFDPTTFSSATVCPTDYTDAQTQVQIDELYKHFCYGDQWLFPACTVHPKILD